VNCLRIIAVAYSVPLMNKPPDASLGYRSRSIASAVSVTATPHHRTNGLRLDRVGRHVDQFRHLDQEGLTSRAFES
jgi:hypothetical protein